MQLSYRICQQHNCCQIKIQEQVEFDCSCFNGIFIFPLLPFPIQPQWISLITKTPANENVQSWKSPNDKYSYLMKWHILPTKDFQESNSQNRNRFHGSSLNNNSNSFGITAIPHVTTRRGDRETEMSELSEGSSFQGAVLGVNVGLACIDCAIGACAFIQASNYWFLFAVWFVWTMFFELSYLVSALCFMLWWLMGLVIANCRLSIQNYLLIFWKYI